MKRKIIVAILIIAAFVSFQHYDRRMAPGNEFLRYMAMLAWSEKHTPYVDPVFTALFPGWKDGHNVPNVDVAEYHGHYYLDKAPGLSILGMMLHPVIRLFLNPFRQGWIELQMLTFLLVTLPALLFLYFVLFKGRDDFAVLTVFALGTPFILYATVFFGILPAGIAAYAGYTLATKNGRPFWGGLLVSAAVLLEYPAFALVAAISLVILLRPGPWRQKLLFFTGYIPTVLLQILYNIVVLGGVFVMSYSHKFNPRFARIMGTGLFGFEYPTLHRLYGLMLSTERGLFFLSPVLIFSFAMFYKPLRHGIRDFAKQWDKALIFLITLIIISGFVDWKAGASAGPRHLIDLLPFMAEPLERGITYIRQWAAGRFAVLLTGIFSMFQVLVTQSTLFYHSFTVSNPLYHEVIPMLLSGCGYFTVFSSVPQVGKVLLFILLAYAGIVLAVELSGIHHPVKALSGFVLASVLVGLVALSLNTLGDGTATGRHTVERQLTQVWWCKVKAPARQWLDLGIGTGRERKTP